MELGIARQVSRELPEGPVADAVVRLHDAAVGLEEAGRCLAPGGVLYGEVDRSPRLAAASPRQIRRQLERAGLTETATYWCHPGFEQCLAYVPLGAPRAVRWYLSSASAGYSLPQKLWRLLLAALARYHGRSIAAATRFYAVTAYTSATRRIEPSLLRHPELPLPLRQAALHVLLLTRGTQRVVMLPFTGDSDHPVAALKVAKARSGVTTEEHEQGVLEAIHASVDGAMARTVPRPYGLIRWNDRVVGMEGGVPGRMLWKPLGRRIVTRQHSGDLRAVAGWLTDFHRQTRTNQVRWGESVYQESMDRSFETYAERLGTAANEQRLFEEVRRRSQELTEVTVPTVWMHGDLHGGNVYRHRGGIAVIDWATGRPGLPLLDLLQFSMFWYCMVQRPESGAEAVRAFRSLFIDRDPGTPAAGAVHDEMSRYMAALDLDQRFFPVFLVLRWADKAVESHRRMQNGAEVAGAKHQVFLRCVQALAADPGRLFAER
ncbi:MAG: phosphotransferase [Gemmatimonadetes bacterium]|nr:phosphotransferase [Gemmatimonadota bacterium]